METFWKHTAQKEGEKKKSTPTWHTPATSRANIIHLHTPTTQPSTWQLVICCISHVALEEREVGGVRGTGFVLIGFDPMTCTTSGSCEQRKPYNYWGIWYNNMQLWLFFISIFILVCLIEKGVLFISTCNLFLGIQMHNVLIWRKS